MFIGGILLTVPRCLGLLLLDALLDTWPLPGLTLLLLAGIFGYLQAFHWAVMSGLPLFIMSHPQGTANAVCGVFECGFPIITREDVEGAGYHRFPASPKDREYRQLLSHKGKPFKVVCFRSHMMTAPCLSGLFKPTDLGDPATLSCRGSRNDHFSAVCWHAKALKALLPRLSRGALLRLPTLESHFHGNFQRVVDLAKSEHNGTAKATYFPSLHVSFFFFFGGGYVSASRAPLL